MTKRVLCTGDSTTRGVVGIGYLPLLAESRPSCEFVNLGLNGDTVAGIRDRTLVHLEKDQGYDLVVIAAGHNDVILTEFGRLSPVHRAIARNLAKRGSVPAADYGEFLSTYRDFIESVRSIAGVPIVAATMSCINEDRSSSTDRMRRRYNQGIRALAGELGVSTADVGGEFDRALDRQVCRDYLMENLPGLLFADRRKSRSSARADDLSRSRGLHLTIDGVHLNSIGARIYASSIEAVL